MAGVGAAWPAMGSSPERGNKEGERGHMCGAPWGGRGVMGRGSGLASCSLLVAAAHFLLVVRAAVHAVREGEEEEESEKKRKGRKRKQNKKKKYGNFSKLENFRKMKDNL
jgi:hypothetical protein